MRILFALPGLHRYDRGAEIAFISIATELCKGGDIVTLVGSGCERHAAPYQFLQAASLRREMFEKFPSMPVLRNEYAYEELTFVPGLLRHFRASDFDVTITCGYPFTNWILRRPALRTRPPHVFVTQNGDWPAQARNSEYRFFGCEGLVCTNPDFYETNAQRWRCKLIPNGIDCNKFSVRPASRSELGLPEDGVVVLMVSALIPSKRVEIGIEAVSQIPDAYLVVAGDGPLREQIDAAAKRLLPGRFKRLTVQADYMPAIYRSADVFLHLSKDESFGNVFLEAMACGVPIVAHDSARSRWIVGNDEYLVDTENPAEIARKIEQARFSSAPQQVRRVAKAAEFSWVKIAQMYRQFLQEIVAST